MIDGKVHLKSGKERKIRNFYPWVQRGECRSEGVGDGDVCRLLDSNGNFLAVGTYNSKSRFLFRVCSLEDRELDHEFFVERFKQAKEFRQDTISGTNSWRLVYSEADLVPGLMVDQFGDQLVVQVRSLGMEKLKVVWLPALIETIQPRGIYEKSDMVGREEEGLGATTGSLYGETESTLVVEEDGMTFLAPVVAGLKTGYYLDQRETRRRFRSRVMPGDKVLDCFCYTGSFALIAAQQGATAYGIDIHPPAIETARQNALDNGIEAVFVESNAFDYLATDSLGPYDWIILDPPAIAKTREKRDSLKWAIWKLVLQALPNLKPGGRLIVCSCSYQLNLQELVEICRLAASDKSTRLVLEDVTYQDVDHPAPIHFPEALYLKCAWLRKV